MKQDPTTTDIVESVDVPEGDADCDEFAEEFVARDPNGIDPPSRVLGWRSRPAKLLDPDRLLRVRTQCDLCGSSTFVETPIHNGESLRRDCSKCTRFLGWPMWFGRNFEG